MSTKKKKKEYSKLLTTIVVSIFSVMAIAFIVFVCYEMHRQNDLSAVAYIGPSIAGILMAVIGFYMWRAKARSQNDLEWEKTKQLTLFRKKYPEFFTRGTVDVTDDDITGGMG